MSRYRFIATERGHYPVRRLCLVLDVPASGFYAWQRSWQGAIGPVTPAWETALVKTFRYHKRRYGTHRLQVVLRQNGYQVGRQRLWVAIRWQGLHALQPKAYTPRTTDSTDGLRCAPNWVWVSNITYLPLTNGSWVVPGRACLCAFQNISTKYVVGWHVGNTMPEELVTTTLQRAFFSQPPTSELLVHSDRSGQYFGKTYRAPLHEHGAVRSQSRCDDCYNNAQAESLWSRLKTEVLELLP